MPSVSSKRKRIEEIFGWLKTVAGLRKTRHRGVARVGWMFTFAAAAYNLVQDAQPLANRHLNLANTSRCATLDLLTSRQPAISTPWSRENS